MRPSFAALEAFVAVLALPALAGAEAPAAAEKATVPAEAGPGEEQPNAVPAAARPGEGASVAVPAVDREPAPLGGPAVPGLPAVEPGGPVGAAKDERHTLAFTPEVVVPFGDWADITGLGFGLTATYAYRATDALALTGRTGYVVHLENERELAGVTTDLHTHEVPLFAGVRFAPLPGLYGALEAGLLHFRAEQEVGDHVKTDGGFRLGGTVGAGYRLDRFDFAARFFLPDLVGRDDGAKLSTGFGMQVGYQLTAF